MKAKKAGASPLSIWLANWKANGIRSKWAEAIEHIQRYDVVITEAKQNDKVAQGELSIPGYLLIRQDRNANAGGVVMYIKK